MDIQAIVAKIARGTTEIIGADQLAAKLRHSEQTKTPLRIKAGFDPTAPDIHLGHAVLLRKLRQFQDLGHRVVFLIGDFTAQVGDPTGRDQLRPKMSHSVIVENAKTYQKQVFKILDEAKTDVLFNSQWLARLTAQEMLELTAFSTVAQMLARSDFKTRYESNKEISILEFIYPLLQGYDSVHLKADVELGGSDQKFNLLMGRQLQTALGQQPQVVIMTPLLEGTDGIKKMSKSLGNYIGINEAPQDIFGKIMSISDELMLRYYELLTDVDLTTIKTLHPKEAKLKLGEAVIALFYPKEEGAVARREFEKIFSQHQLPEDMPAYRIKHNDESLMQVLVSEKLVKSGNDFRRLLKEGAITLDGQCLNEDRRPAPGVVKVGKRRFLKMLAA
jgi:tyrosyl-tRNA synthetase